ncbi:TPA: ACP S-malonyltransferase [Streptococcus agalactiae]|uniref:Malonyl CoA-acyl carrier protein transacylase n=1 Tax=Streptococcus agalactiae TaxID=1311 RepID=A0AB38VNM7_STRAG|nr:ACP S-malonyltransferase [Streptococcus agalactiae]AMD31731.1 ACP S-malonyltransferase [Streptococcus agalactiae]ASZ00773.1 malonyl CoA-acyl carrier protein transacylase [Streptococcus agalactiae]AWZ36835.1 malonyl CoA-acyl carrier protein transacylase [Streptococcus agalactiae]EAO75325.1 malonyl CoA-acyl carrier protein transacylase [Streptococcus agalactiae COH1]EMA8748535.1 ACP S-malonyltransferase [Streptococcus agalactiae]
MNKVAFLFAGQGAQKLGMARDLYETFPIVKETFDKASHVLGYDLRELIDKDLDKLNQTKYTQPAILTTSTAIYRLILKEIGLRPDMVAGLSLGEYSALVASGAIRFEDAVVLVSRRGQLMEAAAPAGSGKMVAVLNADRQIIEDACKKASQFGIVSPANYNTPKQIVIGGESIAVNAAVEELKQQGVKRLIPLNVSGPFHTALLKPASQKLSDVLDKVHFSVSEIPVIGNTEAQIMKKDDIKSLLARQVMEPVRFDESIETMKKMGMTQVVEIGPGKVLSGFLKKIDSSLSVYSVEDKIGFNNLKELN